MVFLGLGLPVSVRAACVLAQHISACGLIALNFMKGSAEEHGF